MTPKLCKSMLLAAAGAMALMACARAQEEAAGPGPAAARAPEDEIIYFLLPDRFENANPDNDRGGFEGGRLDHGHDPTHTGFFHGGDLQGVIERLDYIQGLGATAIWLSPIFENKPVQGEGEMASAGYHGYWITDFLNVDPHIGTREDFRALVEAAHARGMKVYMDIITNHTADVIRYRECHDPEYSGPDAAGEDCAYRAIGDYPWTTRGGPDGEAINDGFLGMDGEHLTAGNFAALTDPRWAYTPYVPEGEEGVKNPAWLNDPIHYNNRGNTRFEGENSVYGDFATLDDLMTTHPRVVEGMIDIYSQWITDFRVDGFRVDTTKHVNIEFWQQFAPAILEHARAQGIEHFHIFGEVYEFDPGQLARFVNEGEVPSVLDFAFQGAARAYVADGQGARVMERFFDEDFAYEGGRATARINPTFLGNHDMGRFSQFVREADPEIPDEELLARTRLAHALMFASRGVPVIYYGDEQGFVSDRGDQGARETLFPSVQDSYVDNDLIGTDASVADENFDTAHPLYAFIAQMAAIRQAHPALRRGELVVRHSDLEGGLLAFSRFDPDTGAEYLAVFNAGEAPRQANVVVNGRSRRFEALAGDCAGEVSAAGSYPVSVPALDFVLCRAVE
ncbi:alpha-amylase family glycosyl hydrolase [Marinicauda algicola]|nr:alpha-amylase family glycosyl hydrolase [Marinicauda algicola]